jgi:hypothetical protein
MSSYLGKDLLLVNLSLTVWTGDER